MEIRELTEADLRDYQEEITKFIYDNLRINLPFIDEAESLAKEKYLDIVKYKEDGTAILYGAIQEKLLGFLWAYERNIFGERRLHLEHLIVDAHERNNGVGSKLIEVLYAEAEARNISKIELMTTEGNDVAVNFYKKHGYEVKRVQMELNVEEQNVD